jgi:hypothetical protein
MELIALVRQLVWRREGVAPPRFSTFAGHCDRDSLTISQHLRQQFAAPALFFTRTQAKAADTAWLG